MLYVYSIYTRSHIIYHILMVNTHRWTGCGCIFYVPTTISLQQVNHRYRNANSVNREHNIVRVASLQQQICRQQFQRRSVRPLFAGNTSLHVCRHTRTHVDYTYTYRYATLYYCTYRFK